jgi:environmental stress-induced protein Ves
MSALPLAGAGPGAAVSPLSIRTEAAPRQRWRNGGGWTRELLAWPGGADWRVRISVADIEASGPFSAFPGVARWFAVLEGRGVELEVDGRASRVTPADAALSFDGAAPTTCRLLDGPTRDLNLMLRGVPGGLRRAGDRAEWRPALAACGLYATVAGRCRHDGDASELQAGTLLWFERAPQRLAFAATDPRHRGDADPADPARATATAFAAGAPAGAASSPRDVGWWLEAGAPAR